MSFSDHTADLSYIRSWVPGSIVRLVSGNLTHGQYNNYMPYIGQPLPPLQWNNLVDIAKQHALASVDSTPTAFMEDLGEIRETIQFLKNPIHGLQRLTDTFIKNKRTIQGIRNKLERAQALAELWSTYRFAVQPLLRSMVDLLELLAHEKPSRPKRQRASGRSKDSSESTEPTIYRATPIQYNQVYKYEALGYRELNAHATILYEVSNPLADWRYLLGLRLKDMPTVAWELLPLSFMVDRLINIRGMIAGVVNYLDPNVEILAASITKRDLSQYTYSFTEWQHSYYMPNIWLKNPDWVQYEDFAMERQTYVPSIIDAIPTLTPGGLVKDLETTLDLLAILLGLIPSARLADEIR